MRRIAEERSRNVVGDRPRSPVPLFLRRVSHRYAAPHARGADDVRAGGERLVRTECRAGGAAFQCRRTERRADDRRRGYERTSRGSEKSGLVGHADSGPKN
jgi:hypothetical protein